MGGRWSPRLSGAGLGAVALVGALAMLGGRLPAAPPAPPTNGSLSAQQEAYEDVESRPPPAPSNEWEDYVGPRVKKALRAPPVPRPFDPVSIPPPPRSRAMDPAAVPGLPPGQRGPPIPVTSRPGVVAFPSPPPQEPQPPEIEELFPSLRRARYTGDGACLKCHALQKEDWRRSIYGRIHYDRSLEDRRRGCEGCHGPGSEHVDEFNRRLRRAAGSPELSGSARPSTWIVNPAKLDRRSLNRLCMSCHTEQRLVRRQQWHFSGHNEASVSCLDCHSVHSPREVRGSLIEAPNNTCYRCHREQEAAFFMTSRHPVRREKVDGLRSLSDGKLRCIDCHKAMSGRQGVPRATDLRESCAGCHPDDRGPFMFEHGAGSQEVSDGCLTCHTAHGSPNRGLLTRPARVLCLTCHTDRVTHNPGPSCTSTMGCHSSIHGSNHNRLFVGTP